MSESISEIRITELKDTIRQLNNTLEAQTSLLKSLEDQLRKKDEREEELQQIIRNLQAQLDYLKHLHFGSSSEKRQILSGQFSMFDESEEPIEVPTLEFEDVKSQPKKPRKPKATYDEMFAGVARREVTVDTLTDEEKHCPECGTELVSIGTEKIRTELVFHPAKLERIDYMAVTYGCPKCNAEATEVGEGYFIKDEGKPALIPGSYASESLAAWTMYQKFGNSLPYYRQSKDMEQYGAHIGRTTMANWAITCSEEYFRPMYDFFHRELLKREFFMADETPVQVLHEDGRRAQTKSYVWLMRSGEDGGNPIILFNYTPTRAGDNARDFLKGCPENAYLMVDGYQGYNKVQNVRICNCWAHVRRYLIDAIPKGHENDYTEPAVQGVLYIDKLFYYEKSYREKGLSFKQIYNRRQKDHKPILEAFWKWFDKLDTGRSAGIRRAHKYIANRRENLETYLEDGRCSFSNNLSENSIRPFTLGRKNWLFCDTPDGASANATIYSMVEMAKAYNLNVYDYLKFVLEARPNAGMTDEELSDLAPWSANAREACNSIAD